MESENENQRAMPTTINIILDTRRMKEKTKTFPVKLRVISSCVPKDFQTVFDLTKEQFQGRKARRLPTEMQVIRDHLAEIEVAARRAVREINPFNFIDFERDFISANEFFMQRKKRNETLVEETLLQPFDFFPYEKGFRFYCMFLKALVEFLKCFNSISKT